MAEQEWPGDPIPAEKAAADRKAAAARSAVDKLVSAGAGLLPDDRALAVVQLAHGPIIDAMIEIEDQFSSSSPNNTFAAAAMLAGELLYRLLSPGPGEAVDGG